MVFIWRIQGLVLSKYLESFHRATLLSPVQPTSKTKPPPAFASGGFLFGGLDWNRTSDTRIFNSCTQEIVNEIAGFRALMCSVLWIVLRDNLGFTGFLNELDVLLRVLCS
jgi:hypothetical protein